VPTRAGIYKRLRTEGHPLSAREVADMFGLHANVARNHLDHLADAGLVVTGTRKHPGGGRPAKVYVAREQAAPDRDLQVPPGSQLAVHTIVQLIAGLTEHTEKLSLLAEDQGRKLVPPPRARRQPGLRGSRGHRGRSAARRLPGGAHRRERPRRGPVVVEGSTSGCAWSARWMVPSVTRWPSASCVVRWPRRRPGAGPRATGTVHAELDEAGIGACPPRSPPSTPATRPTNVGSCWRCGRSCPCAPATTSRS
jgi:predicted transcriptional regulator